MKQVSGESRGFEPSGQIDREERVRMEAIARAHWGVEPPTDEHHRELAAPYANGEVVNGRAIIDGALRDIIEASGQ